MDAAAAVPSHDVRAVSRWLVDQAHIDFSLAKRRSDRGAMLTHWLAHSNAIELYRDALRAAGARA